MQFLTQVKPGRFQEVQPDAEGENQRIGKWKVRKLERSNKYSRHNRINEEMGEDRVHINLLSTLIWKLPAR